MTFSEFTRARLSNSWFFVAPGLIYGIIISRLPALKIAANLNDAQIGQLLLGLGISVVVGLLLCGFIIDRTGIKKILLVSSIALTVLLGMITFIPSYWWMLTFFCLGGIAVGFCNVACNAQGILLEKHFKLPCMSWLHAFSGVGGVLGSLSGSLFAWLNFSPFNNALIMLALFYLCLPFVLANVKEGTASPKGRIAISRWWSLGLFVYICGILNLVCHICEGSVGQWGAILLHSVKGADQQVAALAFAPFTFCLVICRLLADGWRLKFSDAVIFFWGSVTGGIGMLIVLLSPWPILCLAGYGILGAGLAPIVPILFSRAGTVKNVTPGEASAIVSIFSYSGLLVFPPFLGILGNDWGLQNVLWIVVILCAVMALCSVLIPKKPFSGNN